MEESFPNFPGHNFLYFVGMVDVQLLNIVMWVASLWDMLVLKFYDWFHFLFYNIFQHC